MKKRFLFFVIASLIMFPASSPWEGAAAVAPASEIPEAGRYVATNSFPVHTIVEIKNIENNRSAHAIVVKGLDSPGLLALVSRELADVLGMRSGSISRVTMLQPSDPMAYLRFSESLIPESLPDSIDSFVSEEELFERFYSNDSYVPPPVTQTAQTTQVDNLSDAIPPVPVIYSTDRGYVINEPEWGGSGRLSIIDIPRFNINPFEPFKEHNALNITGTELEPEPYTEPAYEPELETYFAFEPEPEFENELTFKPEVESIYEPEPETELAYEPEPEIEPVYETVPEAEIAFEPEPEIEPVYETELVYEQEPEIEPVFEPAELAFEPEPEIEPVYEPEPETVFTYKPEPELGVSPVYIVQEDLSTNDDRDNIVKDVPPKYEETPATEIVKDIPHFTPEDTPAGTIYILVETDEQPPPNSIYGINPDDIIPGLIISFPEIIDEIKTEPLITIPPVTAMQTAPPSQVAVNEQPFSVQTITRLDNGRYYVQLVSVPRDLVEHAISSIDRRYNPVIFASSDNLFRILIGPLNQGESAAILQRFKSIGYKDAFVRLGT